MRRVAPALLVAVALLGACDDDADKPEASGTTTEVPLTLPSTTERQVSDPDDPEDPDEEVGTTSTTEAPVATIPVGLPQGLGIPGAGNLFLGAGSSMSNGFGVRGVPFPEVAFWVAAELQELGWSVQAAPSDDPAVVVLDFFGPGAVGQARIGPSSTDLVDVDLFITGG